MKKLMRLVFVLCLLVFGTQVAFANSDKPTILEGRARPSTGLQVLQRHSFEISRRLRRADGRER